jgi:hypothetical protein
MKMPPVQPMKPCKGCPNPAKCAKRGACMKGR